MRRRKNKTLADYPEAARALRLKNRAAFNALATNTATPGNVTTLYAAVAMSRKLVSMFGHGDGYGLEIGLAEAAALQLWQRQATGFTDVEQTFMARFLDVHEAQLSIVLVGELDAALDEIRKESV